MCAWGRDWQLQPRLSRLWGATMRADRSGTDSRLTVRMTQAQPQELRKTSATPSPVAVITLDQHAYPQQMRPTASVHLLDRLWKWSLACSRTF
jgi:hypothetical protein